MKKLLLALGILISQTVIPAQQKQTLHVSDFVSQEVSLPLYKAVEKNRIETVQVLLKNRLLINQSTFKSIFMDIFVRKDVEMATLLIDASTTEDLNATLINIPDDGDLSLSMLAALTGQGEILALLISKGADIDFKNSRGTVFDYGTGIKNWKRIDTKKAVNAGLEQRKRYELYIIRKKKAYNIIEESLNLLSFPPLAPIIFDYAYGPSTDDLAIPTARSANSLS